jgi:hypothetical protein
MGSPAKLPADPYGYHWAILLEPTRSPPAFLDPLPILAETVVTNYGLAVARARLLQRLRPVPDRCYTVVPWSHYWDRLQVAGLRFTVTPSAHRWQP